MAAEKEAVNNEKTGPKRMSKLARHRKDEQHEQNEENGLKPARANTYRS